MKINDSMHFRPCEQQLMFLPQVIYVKQCNVNKENALIINLLLFELFI